MSIGTYGEPDAVSNAIGYAKHRSQSHDAVIRVCDSAGNVIETHEHAGEFKEYLSSGIRPFCACGICTIPWEIVQLLFVILPAG